MHREIMQNSLYWIKRFKENEDQAMRELIHSYGPRLKQSCRLILKSEADTDEVLQRSFIKAWQGFPRFKGESEIGTWLHRIMVNEALGFLRKEKKYRNERAETDATNIQAAPRNSAQNPLFILMELLSLLPERQRLIFQLRYFEEMPVTLISAKTGLSEGAVKANFHHARKKIEGYIKIKDLH
jgi:RNA polymerase sigma-70 factor, ECF subfamily